MTDTPETHVGLTGTVGYERKVNKAQYESDVASIYVPFDVVLEDAAATEANAQAAFLAAKALVFEQLGLEFKIDNGVAVEILMNRHGAVDVTGTPAANPANDPPRQNNAYQPTQQSSQRPAGGGNRPISLATPPEGVTYLPSECSKCGGTDAWDNRSKATGRQPTFKCANKECGGGFWPPRDGGF